MKNSQRPVSSKAVLTMPLIYFAFYVAIHTVQILVLEERSSDWSKLTDPCFFKEYHSGLLSALTVGICSALLMLSLITTLTTHIQELAMAAPGSLLRVFGIFLVGQTLILIAGHAAIFSSAKALQINPVAELYVEAEASKQGTASGGCPALEQKRMLQGVAADRESRELDVANVVVGLTVSIAVATLWLLESYISGVYGKLTHLFPKHAERARSKTKRLGLLALIPLALIVLKLVVGAVGTHVHPPTVSIMVATIELVVFGVTIWVSLAKH